MTASGHSKNFVLRVVQPALIGLMDGSVSTLAPLFATALATRDPGVTFLVGLAAAVGADRKSTRLNSSHANISYAVFCLKQKNYRNTLILFSPSLSPRPSATVIFRTLTTLPACSPPSCVGLSLARSQTCSPPHLSLPSPR